MSDLSEAERQKLLTKIINQKKKQDLVGLLRAQRDGTLEEYLRPELERAGLLQRQASTEVVVHKPFSNDGPDSVTAHGVSTSTQAASSTSTPAGNQPVPETPTQVTTSVAVGGGASSRGNSGGPPTLGRSRAATVTSSGQQRSGSITSQPPQTASSDKSPPTLRRSSGPGPTLGRNVATTTSSASAAPPQVSVPEEQSSNVAVPKPTISAEDAKATVSKGSVLAKAALFSIGKVPAEQEEFKADNVVVEQVASNPKPAENMVEAATLPTEDQTRSTIVAGDHYSAQVTDKPPQVQQKLERSEPAVGSSTGPPSNLPTRSVGESAQVQASKQQDTSIEPTESKTSKVMEKPNSPPASNPSERPPSTGGKLFGRILSRKKDDEAGSTPAPASASTPPTTTGSSHPATDTSSKDAKALVKTGLVAARASQLQKQPVPNSAVSSSSDQDPTAVGTDQSAAAVITKQATKNTAFASRLAAWQSGVGLKDVAVKPVDETDLDEGDTGRSILERYNEEHGEDTGSENTDDTERAIERPQSIRLGGDFGSFRGSPFALEARKPDRAGEVPSPRPPLDSSPSVSSSNRASLRRPLPPLLEGQALSGTELARTSARLEMNSVRRSARLDPNILHQLQEATRPGVHNPSTTISSETHTAQHTIPNAPVQGSQLQGTPQANDRSSPVTSPSFGTNDETSSKPPSQGFPQPPTAASSEDEKPRGRTSTSGSLQLSVPEGPATPIRPTRPDSPHPRQSRTSDEDFVSSIAYRRRSNSNMPGHQHSKSRFDQLKAAMGDNNLSAQQEPGKTKDADVPLSNANVSPLVAPDATPDPGPPQPETMKVRRPGVTPERVKTDIAALAKRREALGKFPNTNGVLSTYIQFCPIDDRCIPALPEWDLSYVVLANTACYVAYFDPAASKIDGHAQVYGKFQRVLGLKGASLDIVEGSSSPTGLFLRVVNDGGHKGLYLCPENIKQLLEWGSIVQHAIDRVGTVSGTGDTVSSKDTKQNGVVVPPTKWVADYRKRRQDIRRHS